MRPAEHRPPYLAPDVPFDALASWDRQIFRTRPYARILYFSCLALYGTTGIAYMETNKTIYLLIWGGTTLVLVVGVLVYTIRLWTNFHREQKSVDEENRLYESGRNLKKRFDICHVKGDEKSKTWEDTKLVGDHKIGAVISG